MTDGSISPSLCWDPLRFSDGLHHPPATSFIIFPCCTLQHPSFLIQPVSWRYTQKEEKTFETPRKCYKGKGSSGFEHCVFSSGVKTRKYLKSTLYRMIIPSGSLLFIEACGGAHVSSFLLWSCNRVMYSIYPGIIWSYFKDTLSWVKLNKL